MDTVIALFVVLGIITVLGHVIWLAIAAVFKWLLSDGETASPLNVVTPREDPIVRKLRDLDITERVISRFHDKGKIGLEVFQSVLTQIRAERTRITTPPEEPVTQKAPAATSTPPAREPVSVVPAAAEVNHEEIVFKPVPSFMNADETEHAEPPPSPPPRQPRRSFSEVLNSFMEESNIRWGEIIGGLLIIGCSTALVVSLWAQISQIPVLKFLIFTTITAFLFGIGLYTEHRWKLPTTSRGILTIATLLVPLNFLAIAAVSASNTSGGLVIGSELLAPAIFLCLVYFAGRIITPGCAHILAAGVLGSSIGQLLVRHFASLDASPLLMVFLGAFPVICYLVTVGLALRVVLHDREIDESETTTVFTVLGAMSFAAVLPFGLLLHKSGPIGMSMMYLAPLVTLLGLPLLATGTILWRKITSRELVAARTTGTALGILGLMIVLAGMFLAWPNPASIVPAALFNFAIFTALAIALRLPVAHLIAAICFALAYLVTGHVIVGHITWENLRVMSLLAVSFTAGSGKALLPMFALFVLVSEWLAQQKRSHDSVVYLVSACLMAVVSLALMAVLGVPDYLDWWHALWAIYGFYALGAFWIAWRRNLMPFTWVGSALLLFALAHSFRYLAAFAFPWQTALFAHATVCGLAAIISSRFQRGKVLATPLNYSALISIVLGVVCLFQANTWEVTWMQAQRVFWIAGILLLLLWLNRQRILFNLLQISLLCALVLTVKAALQQFDWYSYLPHAFLHPAALQIQGTVLVLFCLFWVALRLLARRALPEQASWLRIVDSRFAIDSLLVWLLIPAFLLLAGYGALSGLTRELFVPGAGYAGFNIAAFPHDEALGAGSWILLGLMLITMLMTFWERRRVRYLLGALVTLAAIIPLLSGKFEYQLATATAWRWLAAIFLLIGSLAIWYRQRISQRLGTLGWPTSIGAGDGSLSVARTLLFVCTIGPLLLLTLIPALRAIAYLPVQSPVAGVFSLMSDDFAYGLPMVLVALVLIGYALRERRSLFALFGGWFLNATVTLAFLLAVVSSGGSMDRVVLVRLVQLNAITFAVFMLPWLSADRRWRALLSEGEQHLADSLLKLQLLLAVALNVVLFAPLLCAVLLRPWDAGVGRIAAGSFLGWLSLIAIVVAAAWMALQRRIRLSAYSCAGLLLSISCLSAFAMTDAGTGNGLHTLTLGVTLTAWWLFLIAELNQTRIEAARFPRNILPRVFDLGSRWQANSRDLAAITGALVVYLSHMILAHEGSSPWWIVGPLLAVTLLAATISWRTKSRGYVVVAGLLFFHVTSLWWWRIGNQGPFRTGEFLLVNVIASSLAGIVWLWLDLRARQKEKSKEYYLSIQSLAAAFFPGVLALVVGVNFILIWLEEVVVSPRLIWLAMLSFAVFLIACLFDRYVKHAVAALYILGLIACVFVLQQLQLSATDFAWSATLILAAYSLIAVLIWHRRERLIEFAKRFGMPERIRPDATQLHWLSVFTALAIATIGILAYWINLRFLDFDLRISAALAVAAQFLTLGLLAKGSSTSHWRRAAIVVFVIGAIFTGWSWLTPGINATWLNRSVILMVAVFGLTAVYGLLLDKATARFPDWTKSARACVPWLIGTGVVALFLCLATEVSYQLDFGAVLINPLSLTAIGVTLIVAAVACVHFALTPKHDPLSLSERGRMNYVYAAEVFLALLFLHIRLTMPWLFSGFISRYWPVVVMSIAYFGVVISESLRRRNLLVLAQPLERTGAFLPLLPVFGFWVASSEVDFSLLLFIVGGLYGLLSVLRRSLGFGMVAAIAGNAGLWYAFHHTADYQFWQHPQLWLIPVALSVLVAAYLNEEQLTEEQMTGVRYLSLVTIYVSSTADIFINGVANSPWLPLILGSFSLAGVFAGILLRIRGLLLLGAIFLLLSIVTMIWYASVNFGWTWLWYVAGIATGATIIFMFAVFEKKRSEVLRVVDGLKDWDR